MEAAAALLGLPQVPETIGGHRSLAGVVEVNFVATAIARKRLVAHVSSAS